jgi:predicted dehydrogenase
MTERSALHIGIIGAGLKGQHHLRNLKNLMDTKVFAKRADVRLVSIADTDATRANATAKQFGIPEVYTDGFELIKKSAANIVYICTPTVFHKDLALDAILDGKDVYCEKPVAFTVRDINDIIRARNEQGGVLVQVGMEARSHPLIPYLKQLAKNNAEETGRLMNVHFRDTQMKPYRNDPSHPSTWRKEKALAHHGILFEHSVHDLDAFLNVFGSVRRVFGTAKYFAGHNQIEDSITAMLDLDNGATINMTGVWNNVALDERLVEIFWENAYLKLRYSNIETETQFWVGTEEPAPLDEIAVLQAFMEELGIPNLDPIPVDPCRYANARWLDHLIRRAPAYPSLEDARAVQTIIEAIYASAERGQAVDFID